MLKTATGFHSRNRAICPAVSLTSRHKLKIRVATPRFLIPPTRIFSRRNPAAGTSRFSTPRSVPTNKTRYPIRQTSRATAIAGITCPPVPPPAITKRSPGKRSPGMFGDIQQNSQRSQRHQQRTAPEADHRQWNPFRRHHPENDAHIEERLDHQHGGDPEREISSKFIGDQHHVGGPGVLQYE